MEDNREITFFNAMTLAAVSGDELIPDIIELISEFRETFGHETFMEFMADQDQAWLYSPAFSGYELKKWVCYSVYGSGWDLHTMEDYRRWSPDQARRALARIADAAQEQLDHQDWIANTDPGMGIGEVR